MTAAEALVGLVVARDLAAVEPTVRRAGLARAEVGMTASPTVPHVAVDLPDAEARHAVARLAAAHGWLVLLSPPATYRRAGTLLILATRLPVSRRTVHVNELLVYQVLAATSEEEQEALVRAVLGPVLDLTPSLMARLLTTLETLHWHEGSAKATARALGLHSKTVLNRVRRFEALTGLCLDRPPDRLRADIALYVLRLRGRLARVEIETGAPAPASADNGPRGVLQANRVRLAAAPS